MRLGMADFMPPSKQRSIEPEYLLSLVVGLTDRWIVGSGLR